MLGSLIKQPHMSQDLLDYDSLQLYKCCAGFLYGMKQCRNYIVRTCLTIAMHNAKTQLGHNLAFFRNKYGIDILCDVYNHCMRFIRYPN